jgi:hypothetical protein
MGYSASPILSPIQSNNGRQHSSYPRYYPPPIPPPAPRPSFVSGYSLNSSSNPEASGSNSTNHQQLVPLVDQVHSVSNAFNNSNTRFSRGSVIVRLDTCDIGF